MTESMQMNSLLNQMRQLEGIARRDVPQTESVKELETEAPGFSNMLKDAIDSVNDLQKTSGQLQQAFIQGDPNVDIARVMVASQKSGIAFQAVVQVRNKMLESYKDIMSMPV